MQPQILILGAGKSASVLIEYLQQKAVEFNWYIILADANEAVAKNKWNHAKNGHAIGFDIEDEAIRATYIQQSTLVVSMLPPFLHAKVATACLQFEKPLFTASYVDTQMKTLEAELLDKKLLFLCEMGLDPGIDHMSAMELIHRIQKKGGVITRFKSHCGGLIAPESDTNPWHYKISWNPRNIILAGKGGALFLENGGTKSLPYEILFHQSPQLPIPGIGTLSYYPNRNSLPYIETYALEGVKDFVRTTLRHPQFCSGWDAIVQLDLTNENAINLNEKETIKSWFLQHLAQKQLEHLYQKMLQDSILKEQLLFIGLEEELMIPDHVKASNASILQWLLESKWKLDATDKDMVVMMHEITYELENETKNIQSSLVIKGKNAIQTAMATTVGLPLAMGVCAYLKGEITLAGLHIPTHPSIYQPVLKSLAAEGIVFTENSF